VALVAALSTNRARMRPARRLAFILRLDISQQRIRVVRRRAHRLGRDFYIQKFSRSIRDPCANVLAIRVAERQDVLCTKRIHGALGALRVSVLAIPPHIGVPVDLEFPVLSASQLAGEALL
jgi:hypothetical protein